MKKALLTYQKMAPTEGRPESVEFKSLRGCLEKFMHRLFSFRGKKKKSVAQKDPDKLIDN